ncbi:MAG: PEGA domain-containing protein [Candidatus Pacebacteria bacterium]|nr:PEGA domain-containing protein [Candidatus Paceibacterota bacterium]
MKTLGTKLFMGVVIVSSALLFSGCNPLERKNKAGLQVITNDEIVSIFIDDQFLGKSPFLTKDIRPGEYIVKLEPENTHLTAYETTLNLRKGMLSVITWKPGPSLAESGGVIYELEKLPDKNDREVSVLSIPDGGIISIDGKSKQFAPYNEEEIEEGSHDFEISLPSYETQNHTINIVKGHRLNILVKLAKDNVVHTGEIAPLAEEVAPTESTQSSQIQRKTTINATNSGEVEGVSISATSPQPAAQPLRAPPKSVSLGGGKVLIKKTNYFENGVEVLKVRDASTSAGKVIGIVESGKQYPYLGEKTQNWIKLSINNKEGWASTLYAEVK